MNDLKKILQDLKEQNKLDILTKGKVLALKQMWMDEQRHNKKLCEKCGKWDNLTLDHIIPVQMIKEMGIEEDKKFMPENYRVLCRICNSFKGNRLDYSEKRTKELLIKYLEAI